MCCHSLILCASFSFGTELWSISSVKYHSPNEKPLVPIYWSTRTNDYKQTLNAIKTPQNDFVLTWRLAPAVMLILKTIFYMKSLVVWMYPKYSRLFHVHISLFPYMCMLCVRACARVIIKFLENVWNMVQIYILITCIQV